MAEQVFVGIDLAWNTNAATGIAVVDDAGALLDSATLHADDQIVAWLTRPEWQPITSAVDAPLIVTNSTGQRPCERLISQAFGRYNASCHTSNLGVAYFNPPRGGALAERLGWNLDPEDAGTAARPGCIEVYPHPAMVALFQLGSVLPYKAKSGRTVDFRRSAFVELLDRMETLQHLRLTDNVRWAGLRQAVIGATRQVDLERLEDEIDAIFCAHLAWLWHYDHDSLQIYGDVSSGYIVAPPPPTHAAVKIQRREKRPGTLGRVRSHVPGTNPHGTHSCIQRRQPPSGCRDPRPEDQRGPWADSQRECNRDTDETGRNGALQEG